MNKLGDYLIFKNGSTSPERSPELPFPVFGSNGIIGNSASANVEIASVIIGRVGTYCGSVFYSPTPAHVTDNAMYATPIKSGQTQYWYYVLKNLNLHRLRHGSGQPLLNQTILKQIDFKAHPIEEQQGISATLGALDDKIESNMRLVKLIPEIISVYVTKELENNCSEVPVSNLAEFVNGGAYTKGASGNGRVVIRIAELNSGIGSSTVYNNIEAPNNKTARAGDILMSWSGTLGVYV